MVKITDNINKTLQQIKQAESKYHREPGSVQLLAISKRSSIVEIKTAVAAGLTAFGESYLQDAAPKIEALADLNLKWHFIGPIQSNKTKLIAENFNWVHSIDRVKIARRLSEQRPAHAPPLDICIQIKIGEEDTKSGILLADLSRFAAEISRLPRLKLRGLMTIPKQITDFSTQRLAFRKLHTAMLALNEQGFTLDTLSMGMSADFIAAIAEGATIVRLGNALFGSS